MPAKYIRFVETAPKPKTRVWTVLAVDGNVPLGEVKWFGRWRGYAFFPGPELVFERTCLRDIADFIEKQNADHRASLLPA